MPSKKAACKYLLGLHDSPCIGNYLDGKEEITGYLQLVGKSSVKLGGSSEREF